MVIHDDLDDDWGTSYASYASYALFFASCAQKTSGSHQDGNGKSEDWNILFFDGTSSGWWFGTFFYFHIFPFGWECHHPN